MSEWSQPICEEIWRSKYRYGDEKTFADTCERVVKGVYRHDESELAAGSALAAMVQKRWMPAGRIFAGAGTDKHVTLINCFVSPTIRDAIATRTEDAGDNSLGIFDALTVAAQTQQMGGGIGMDFTPIRPRGSPLKRTGEGAVASGPVSFMRVWNTMCETMMSAGSRRGAMMATLRCDHPDIFEFVNAKNTPGELTNFNVSVLVTDAFMQTVKNDGEWCLVHHGRPAGGTHAEGMDDGRFVHRLIRARDLWNAIMRNTYDHAEPGVIFIDRVNKLNNFNYCETISATNPCGEQPLPPNGDCNLGHINLAAHVNNRGLMGWGLLADTVRVGVRFLDNVIDVTRFPTEAQRREAEEKRRIGLGVTGLANALQMMKLRYGSATAVKQTKAIMKFIAANAYQASMKLAEEREAFPLYNKREMLNAPFISKLCDATPGLKERIEKHGLRNGVLLTCAPTGTTSIMYDNVSSGIEPTFAWHYTRKVRQADGDFRPQYVTDYGWGWFLKGFKLPRAIPVKQATLPDYMVTTQELTVDDHLRMQSACQEWVDAAISKTINVPTDTPFETFQGVYLNAYDMGLKGITTYRHNPESGRGSILEVGTKVEVTPEEASLFSDKAELKNEGDPINYIGQQFADEEDADEEDYVVGEKRPRPPVLVGLTKKIRWPEAEGAHYVTLNSTSDGKPFEVFISSKDTQHAEWIQALTLLITSIFRRGGDTTFWIRELKEVRSVNGGVWMKGEHEEKQHYVPSLVAYIAETIESILKPPESSDVASDAPVVTVKKKDASQEYIGPRTMRPCPKCMQLSLARESGCDVCKSCDYSKCG